MSTLGMFSTLGGYDACGDVLMISPNVLMVFPQCTEHTLYRVISAVLWRIFSIHEACEDMQYPQRKSHSIFI